MTALDEDYLTVTEAATLLRVAPSTIRRWIREGDVPAYRLGQRRIALRRMDLATLVTPVRPGVEGASTRSIDDHLEIRRMTPRSSNAGWPPWSTPERCAGRSWRNAAANYSLPRGKSSMKCATSAQGS